MACLRSHSKYGRELGFEPRSLQARYPLEEMLGRRAGGEIYFRASQLHYYGQFRVRSSSVGGCLGHCGVFSSIPDTHPLDARSILSEVMTTTDVPRHCPVLGSPGQDHLGLGTPELEIAHSWLKLSGKPP